MISKLMRVKIQKKHKKKVGKTWIWVWENLKETLTLIADTYVWVGMKISILLIASFYKTKLLLGAYYPVAKKIFVQKLKQTKKFAVVKRKLLKKVFVCKRKVLIKLINIFRKRIQKEIKKRGSFLRSPNVQITLSMLLIKLKKRFLTFSFSVKRIFSNMITLELRIRIFSVRTIFLIFFLIGVYLISVFYFVIYEDIPTPSDLIAKVPRLTTTIYDRRGKVLYRLYDDEDRVPISLDEVPQDLINATIAIEDQDFYKHKGLSARGILRAAKRTFFEEDLQGGSTITQQLVKNVLLSPDRTIKRKLKEVIIAVEVERRFTKNEILEMYLNAISYGGTAYGVKSASRMYFNKSLGELSLAESAFLAGLPAAPTTYSPYSRNKRLGKKRQSLVLTRMYEDGYITSEQFHSALNEDLVFAKKIDKIEAPHFVNYVLSDLEQRYGTQLISQGGLDVYTSIDMEIQKAVEEIVAKNVVSLSKNNVNNGAALVTNPATGEILAMVGSADYWNEEIDGNVNVTISPRQPGSSIKPVTYSLAFERGFLPSSIIQDTPVSYHISKSRAYTPVNYDGRYHGSMTLKAALANSYNVPAVKILDIIGVENLLAHAERLGITTWKDRDKYGLSLTLGAGEVKMTDMAVAYGTFAKLGYKKDLNPILKIYDSFGNVMEENDCVNFLEEPPTILTKRKVFESAALAATGRDQRSRYLNGLSCTKEKILKETTAYYISYILSDNNARSKAFGSNSALNIMNRQVAVKTGTTTDLKDNWAVGYTDDYVVVAWVGNNDNKPMHDVVSGYRGASIIWREIFDFLIKNRDVKEKLAMPESIVEVDVCPLTGTLACDGCPNEKQIFVKGREPLERCDSSIVYKMLHKDKKEGNNQKEGDTGNE